METSLIPKPQFNLVPTNNGHDAQAILFIARSLHLNLHETARKTELVEATNVKLAKQVYHALYWPIYKTLHETLPKFAIDPTSALKELQDLHNDILNLID